MRPSKESASDYETRGEVIPPRQRVFVLNNPLAPRLCPELAQEIGLNESILLLQIDFWISTSTTEPHEGRWWTFQSVRDIQETFSFWSLATINRTIQSLLDSKYILTGNFNRLKYDKTRWFALNPEVLKSLKSIRLDGHETPLFQNDTRSAQNETRSTQFETTIPETSTEISTETTTTTIPAVAVEKPKTRSKTNGHPPVDEKAALVFQLYQKQINFNFSATMAERIRDDIEDVPLECIAPAFERAEIANVKRWDYVTGIWSRWRANGWQMDAGKRNGSSPPPDNADAPVVRRHEDWVRGELVEGEELEAGFERLKREGKVPQNAVLKRRDYEHEIYA